MKVRPRLPNNLPQAAFSLVEVAIALGIVGFVAIPMVGLLLSGFRTIQLSNSEMRSAIIAQRMIANAQMQPFAILSDKVLNLDSEGLEVPSEDAVFQVRMQVAKNPAGDVITSPNLARLSVSVTGRAMQNETKVYSGIVANVGH